MCALRNTIHPLPKAAMALALSYIAFGAGCDPEVPHRASGPDRVEAIFDPDTGEIPLPNDVAMENGRLPGIPGADPESPQGALSNYMRQLRGWPKNTGIEIPFSGALDEESIDDDAVRLYRIIDEEQLQRAPVASLHYDSPEDAEKSTIEVIPAESPQPGEQYAIAVTGDLMGANGAPVAAALPLFFAASRSALVDDQGRPTLEIFEDDPETAVSLEGLRQFLAPLFDAIEEGVGEEEGIDRDDLATVFRWTWMPETMLSLNPDEAKIPIPHTAALDDDGTFPDQAVCHLDEDSAQGDFDRYLANLAGWPDSVPITIPLSQPVDATSIGDGDVQVWENDGTGWERMEIASVTYRDTDVDICTGEESSVHLLDVELAESMQNQSDYFGFVKRDILPGEKPLVPELPMLLAIQPYDLVDENGASTLDLVDDETAAALQGLRDIISPAVEFIDQQLGLSHEELAGVWSWYTWNDAFAVFDPESAIPFPNAALIGDDDTVQLPVPDGADPLMQGLIESLNRRTRFSAIAPGWVPTEGELDPSSIDFDAFRLINLGTLGFLDEQELQLRVEPQLDRLVYEPVTPLGMRQMHVGMITEQARGTNGRPIQPTPAFLFLRGQHPVYEDGHSTVDVLDDQTAQQLEDARQIFQFIFDLAEQTANLERSELATAWAFTVEDAALPLRQYRALVHDALDARPQVRAMRHCEVEPPCGAPGSSPHQQTVGAELEDPNNPGHMVPMDNIQAVNTGGQFASIEVDVENRSVSEGDEQIGISVYLPESGQSEGTCVPPFDVAIAQHGLRGDRWQSGLSLANDLAAYPNCMATVAMDFPLHGGRTPGSASPHPEQTPSSSGDGFLSADLIASQEYFLQSVVDLFTLVRVIQGDQPNTSGLDDLFEGMDTGGSLLDSIFSDRIGYVGMSLGGISGVPFAALEPTVETVAISSSGGRLSWLLEGDDDGPSEIGAPILELLEQGTGIERGTPEFFQAMAFVQWFSDWVDPIAFAPAATNDHENTLVYVPEDDDFESGESVEPPQFLIQMAEDDRVIVNRGTRSLARALGVSLDDTTFSDVPHSFIGITEPGADGFAAGQCARRQAAAWLHSGMTGTAQLPGHLSATECY